MTPDGRCFEGKGLDPDGVVEVPARELGKRDPILDKALALLRSKVGGKKQRPAAAPGNSDGPGLRGRNPGP